MEQYIPKSVLVAEIEKIIPSEPYPRTSETLYGAEKYGKREMCFRILDLIDSLEVKEVNLKKEIEEYLSTYWSNEKELHLFLEHTAKYFFELGLKTQKGE